MKNYIAFWPDETFTVLSASSLLDLYWSLDNEGDPDGAEVYRLAGKFSVRQINVPGRSSLQDIEVDGQRERISLEECFKSKSIHTTP